MIKLFNTFTRKKETLNPLESGKVKMYTCGPTVYDFAHIGNFRTYVFEDLLKRTLRFFDYHVLHVMNITDVDDKTIRGAIRSGVSLKEYTKPFELAFFSDLEKLHIAAADHYPAATEYIPQMVEAIQSLLDKSVAYISRDKSIYFSIKKFSPYGCLSHFVLDDLQAGASERVVADEYDKDHISDFVLWKSYDQERDGQIYWQSPWGPGRPGWHLECSVMAMSLLGKTLDIHCGGVDNLFPHHENEIAQSEACSGEKFANLWMHCEHLLVDNKKMSKSAGNFYTLRSLIELGFSPVQVRYLLLQTHYKTKLNFTLKGLESAKNALNRLNDFAQRLHKIGGSHSTPQLALILDKASTDFSNALSDDLNISAALAAVFDMVRDIHSLADRDLLSHLDAQSVLDQMRRFNSVLAVMDIEPTEERIPEDVLQALRDRAQARADRCWREADELRDFIAAKGYTIEDTPEGPSLKKIG